MGWGSINPDELSRGVALERRSKWGRAVLVPRKPEVPVQKERPLPSPTPPRGESRGLMARLEALGVVRCLKIESGEGGDYLVLLRLTLHNGQRVYRYGRTPDLPAVTRLLDHWLKRQYWTPDRLDDQWRPSVRRR